MGNCVGFKQKNTGVGIVSYNLFLSGYIDNRDFDNFKKTLLIMKSLNLKDKLTYALSIKYYALIGDVENMEIEYQERIKHYKTNDDYIIYWISYGYRKLNDIESVSEVTEFATPIVSNPITLIENVLSLKDQDSFIKLWEQYKKIESKLITFTAVESFINGFGELKNLDMVVKVYNQSLKWGMSTKLDMEYAVCKAFIKNEINVPVFQSWIDDIENRRKNEVEIKKFKWKDFFSLIYEYSPRF